MDMSGRYCRSIKVFLAACMLLFSMNAHAAWRDFLNVFSEDEKSTELTKEVMTGLSQTDIVDGLKEALTKGTRAAVAMLGKKDGFLANTKVKIPMPESLRKIDKGLRKMGQDKVADNFVETMNRAAENAVPQAAAIFSDAVKNMSIADAKEILQGDDDAATRYFRQNSSEQLREKFLPVVKQATSRAGVTSSYKKLTDKLGFLSNMVDTRSLDLDEYVTDKAMDGLFIMVAEEEKKIRENPLARTSELLKKVFGSTGSDQ